MLASLGWPVFVLQSNIWICFGIAAGSASRPHENNNGTYNMKRAAARTVPCMGTVINAVLVAWLTVNTCDDMEARAVAYVTWWAAGLPRHERIRIDCAAGHARPP